MSPYQSAWSSTSGGVSVHVEEGSYWLARKGTVGGPSRDRIPPWCEKDSGPWGLWQPCGVFPDGKVLWRIMIRPTEEPTETERLAELNYEEETG